VRERRLLQAEISTLLAKDVAQVVQSTTWFDATTKNEAAVAELHRYAVGMEVDPTITAGGDGDTNSSGGAGDSGTGVLVEHLRLWQLVAPLALGLDALRTHVQLVTVVDGLAAGTLHRAAAQGFTYIPTPEKKKAKKEKKKEKKQQPVQNDARSSGNASKGSSDNNAAALNPLVQVLCATRFLLAGFGSASPTALLATLGGSVAVPRAGTGALTATSLPANDGLGSIVQLAAVLLDNSITITNVPPGTVESIQACTYTIIETVFSQAVHAGSAPTGTAPTGTAPTTGLNIAPATDVTAVLNASRRDAATQFASLVAAHMASNGLVQNRATVLTALRLGTAACAGILGGRHHMHMSHMPGRAVAGRDQLAWCMGEVLVRVNALIATAPLTGGEDDAVLHAFATGLRMSRECGSVETLPACDWNRTLDELLSKVSTLLTTMNDPVAAARYLYFIQKVRCTDAVLNGLICAR
jgi:hypothetical protein